MELRLQANTFSTVVTIVIVTSVLKTILSTQEAQLLLEDRATRKHAKDS